MDLFPFASQIAAHISSPDKKKIATALEILHESKVVDMLASSYVSFESKARSLQAIDLENDLISLLIYSAHILKVYAVDIEIWERLILGCIEERNGMPFVRIELAQELDSKMKENIENTIQKKLFPSAKKCNFPYSKNTQLIGGLVIKHNDQVWDASVANLLFLFQKQFNSSL